MTRTARAWRAGLLLAGLTGAACQSPTGASEMPGSELERLNRNLALWRSQGVSSYRFDYRHTCFCPPPTPIRSRSSCAGAPSSP